MAACTCTSLIFTSFIDVPSFVCVEPRYLNYSHFFLCFSNHPYVGRWSWRDAVENFAFVGANSHAVTSSSFLQYFSELFFCTFYQLLMSSAYCKLQTNSKAVVLQRTLTTARFKFLLHLLLHHLQSSHSLMDADVSKLSVLLGRWRYSIGCLLPLLCLQRCVL